MIRVICTGWKNKKGTSERKCKCKTWKQHWLNFSKEKWPEKCCVKDCKEAAALGAHIYNSKEEGEWIVPACEACNKRTDEFSLDSNTTLVPANKQKTCEVILPTERMVGGTI